MNKRMLVKALCAVLVLMMMVGCVAVSAEQYEIAVIAKNAESQWGIRQESGVNQYAADSGNIAYQKGPAKVDASSQLQLLEDVIAQGVDAICIIPVDVESVEPALKRAREDGIVVIVNEGTAVVNKDYSIDAFNNDAFGAYMMDFLAEQMGSEGTYTTMVGSLSNGSHNIWADAGVARQLAEYPNMHILESDPRVESGDDTEIAYEKMKELVKKYPDLKGIQGASSADLPGIAKAVEELGLVGDICISGLGTPNKCRQYLESGALKGICTWDPAGAGYAMCALAQKVLEGADIVDGLDLGLEGYNSILFAEGSTTNIQGSGMIVIAADTVNNYDF